MPRRSLSLSCVALLFACAGRPLDDDEVGDEGLSTESTDGSTSEGSTSETTSTTSETEDSTDDGFDSCGGFELDTEIIPWNMVLVVDTSSSMALETWDDDGDPLTPEVTRWRTARALVEGLVAGVDDNQFLGLRRFPSADACPGATPQSANCTDADACVLLGQPEAGLSPASDLQILASLPDADADAAEVAGGSPASAAMLAARDQLLAQDRASPRLIMLVTDGGANCGEGSSLPESFETYDDALVSIVEDAFVLDSIVTFVVGVDIEMGEVMAGDDRPQQVDPFAALNAIALAGGAPAQLGMQPQKFYDASDPQALLDGLDSFFPDESTCTIDLTTAPGGPPDPWQIPYVTVELDDDPVPFVDPEECEIEDGWTWIVEGALLTFCGSWCEVMKDGASVDVIYQCVGE